MDPDDRPGRDRAPTPEDPMSDFDLSDDDLGEINSDLGPEPDINFDDIFECPTPPDAQDPDDLPPAIVAKLPADWGPQILVARNIANSQVDAPDRAVNVKCRIHLTSHLQGFTRVHSTILHTPDIYLFARDSASLDKDRRRNGANRSIHGKYYGTPYVSCNGITVTAMRVSNKFVVYDRESLIGDIIAARDPSKRVDDFFYNQLIPGGGVQNMPIPQAIRNVPVFMWGDVPTLHCSGLIGGARSKPAHVKTWKPRLFDYTKPGARRPVATFPSRKRSQPPVRGADRYSSRTVRTDLPPEHRGMPSFNANFVANQRVGAPQRQRLPPKPDSEPFYRGREPDVGRMDDVRLNMGRAS